MTIFKRIKHLLHSEPEEQIIGYSRSELRLLFPHPVLAGWAGWSRAYPQKASLEPLNIHAIYTSLLIDKDDLEHFMTLVEGRFSAESTRQFQGALVIHNKSMQGDERLCFMISDEFESHALKCVTNSLDFLDDIDRCGFAVPPPWVAFEDTDPESWGGAMQGAQGYYDDNYFSPFFLGLNAEQKRAYYEKFGASPKWARALELFYGPDEKPI